MATTAEDTAGKRGKHPKANKGSFGIGRDPLERYGGNPPEKPEPPPRVEVDGEGLIADYRFVWENDKAHDDTPKRKTLRKLLVNDPRGFVKDLKELEKAQAAGGGSAKAGLVEGGGASHSPPAADSGADRAKGLIERLLSRADAEARG